MSAATHTSTIELWSSWEGHVINGVYPLRRHLGSSDHSGVFLTEARAATSSDLAIKIVPATSVHAEAMLSRWLTVGELDHPNLVQIFEAGRCQVDGRPYLYAIMEYADQDLAQLLQRRALTEEETREMLVPVLGALGFLHQKKFAQGRVKPSNILVVGDQLKLASDTICREGEAVESGSPVLAYDSPEARETGRTAAGDIWSLGVTICEALTRRQPLALHGGGNPVFPVDLSPAFRELVAWCLSRRAYDRPEVAELEASLRGERTVPIAIPAVEPGAVGVTPDASDASAAADTSIASAPADEPIAAATADAPAATANAPFDAPVAGAAAVTLTASAIAEQPAPAPTPVPLAPVVPAAVQAASSASPSASSAAPEASAPPAPAVARGSITVSTAPEPFAAPTATREPSAQPASAETRASGSPAPAMNVSSTAARSHAAVPNPVAPGATSPGPGGVEPGVTGKRATASGSTQPPSRAVGSRPRYALWAASFAAVLVIVWGGTKMLGGPSSESAPDTVAEALSDEAADSADGSSAGPAADPGAGRGVASDGADASRTDVGTNTAAAVPRRATPDAALASLAARPSSTRPASTGPTSTRADGSADITEVLPDVPTSASRTIRGRVRVSVRVIVEQDGTVFAALADNPGPSRYFERLAIDAAKKWTFGPVDTTEQRLMLVRFTFTRQGTTAESTALR